MRTAAVRTLTDLAREDRRIMLLTADLGYRLLEPFRDAVSDQFLNIGVAEANMIGIAAGLAIEGQIVYCYSMIPFLAMRALEQIRTDVCVHRLKVRLLGVGAGLGYGLEGATHHAIEDLAIMRALPGMTVVAPGDPYEMESALRALVDHPGPVFFRIAGRGEPNIHSAPPVFQPGRAFLLQEGDTVTLIATSTMLSVASQVCQRLTQEGISCTLISMPCIKPLDVEIIRNRVRFSPFVFTLEEHNILGGLGGAVAEVLMDAGGFVGHFERIGLPDTFCKHIGSPNYLREMSGLGPDAVYTRVLRAMAGSTRAAAR